MTASWQPSADAGRPAGHATLSAELEGWLRRHIARGFGADALMRSMRQSGYDEQFTIATVHAALSAAGHVEAEPARRAGPGFHASPQPVGADGFKADQTSPDPNLARAVSLLFALDSPRISLYQNLLDGDECDALITLARGRLARSPVINPDTGKENLISARTSRGAMFHVGEFSLIQQLEARIAAVTGIAVERGEGLQILNYQTGAEYQPHFDYFNPLRPGEARQLSVGGQRIATMVIYLNSVQAGGATAFPKVGVKVSPVRGNAVYFEYRRGDGTLDERTLHAGLPVEAGEKWIATKWLREFPYRTGK